MSQAQRPRSSRGQRRTSAGLLSCLRFCATLAVALTLDPAPAAAQDTFAGKTVTISVGFGPGGGYDLYARLVARHLGRHLPGHPTVVVANMPGAASIRAANYIANV